jgi:hypothetical protein
MKAIARFRARIEGIRGGGHFVAVPERAAEQAELKYGVRVRGSVEGVAYRSSLMKYSGVFHLGVHKATLAAAGAKAGDTVEVTLERDPDPLPEDTVPPPLARAIAKSKTARAAWQKLAPSHRREHVRHVNDAKREETRRARIEKIVRALEERS